MCKRSSFDRQRPQTLRSPSMFTFSYANVSTGTAAPVAGSVAGANSKAQSKFIVAIIYAITF